MASVTSRSWTTVLVIAAISLAVLLSASPEAREQARQGAEQMGTIMIQIFASVGDILRSLLRLDVNLGNG